MPRDARNVATPPSACQSLPAKCVKNVTIPAPHAPKVGQFANFRWTLQNSLTTRPVSTDSPPAMRTPFALAVFATVASLSPQLHAQNATTTPVGAFTITLAAGSVDAPRQTNFNIPLRSTPPGNFVGKTVGTLTGVTSTTVTDSTAGWGNGTLSTASSPYLIRFLSGNQTGLTLQISTTAANTATTATILTQGTDLTVLGVAAGDRYELNPADTLMSVFGVGGNGTGGILAGTAATADIVSIFNGSGWVDYFYSSAAGQWRQGILPLSQNNVVIPPNSGVAVRRRASSALQLVFTGTVPVTNTKAIVRNSGASFISTGFPTDMTLASISLNSTPGWKSVNPTTTSANADKVRFHNGSGWVEYFHNATAGQWRQGILATDRNGVVVPAGSPILIMRASADAGSSIATVGIPYTLN